MAPGQVHNSSEWFTAKKAAQLSGLSAVMVNYLCRQQVVEPTCGCSRGHGARRHYSFGDVVALRLIAQLSKAGVSVTRLKAAFTRLRERHPEITIQSLPGKRAVTDGRDIYFRDKEGPLERASDGQFAFAFVVELDQISQEVIAELKKVV
jgi:DNA-binding transcriptional MerR regulator